jgi:hypothetical protein
VLLKAADTNNFIRDDAMKTMIATVENIQPQRVLMVLGACGVRSELTNNV